VTDLPERPALAEDVLLLLFSPDSGTIAGEGQRLFHTLAGAVLIDLALQERIEIDERQTWKGQAVRATTEQAPGDPLLATAWERIVRKPVDVHVLINEIGPRLREKVLERVIERGDIEARRRRALGFIPMTALRDGGTHRRERLLAPVRSTLVDGTDPDERSAALAALLFASGSLPELYRDIPWNAAVYRRGEQLQQAEWGASAAGEAVRRTVAGITASSVFVTAVLPNT
jgi:hypothetical protein